MNRTTKAAAFALGASVAALAPSPAAAQDGGDFYRGRTVRILVGVGVGGDYDTQARLVSRHIGRQIPGEPGVIVENMIGAGGLNMVNYAQTLAAKDGSTLAVVPNNFPAQQWVGGRGIQFDLNQFGWIGALTTETEAMAAWHTSGIRTIEDAQKNEVITAASGRGAISYSFPAMLNALIGTRFKLVTGYSGGNEMNLAIERGEAVARLNSWSGWKTTRPEWVKNGWLNILVQAGRRHPDLAHVPSLEPMARTPEDRQLMDAVNLGNELGRPLAAPPGVPAERLRMLREAFHKMTSDPKLLGEAAQMRMELAPTMGDEMQQKIARLLATPKSLVPRAKDFLE